MLDTMTGDGLSDPSDRERAEGRMKGPKGITNGLLRAVETPQTVVAAASRPNHLASLVRLLRAAGLPQDEQAASVPGRPKLISQDSIGPLAALPGWLAEHPTAHLILLVPLPAVAVARRLGEGMGPKPALAQWLESAEAVLSVIRPHRGRASLVFAEHALVAPEAFLTSVAQRLQLGLQQVRAEDEPPELPSAMLRMMAENAIWQSAEARSLASEMQATALPLAAASELLLPDVQGVFEEYRKGIESLAAAQHKAKISEELQEENELLLLQLHQVQEELEHYFLLSTQPAASPRHTTDELEDAHQTIRAIHSSYSWKVTKPLRWVQSALTGGRRRASDQAPMPESLSAANETIQALYNSKSWKLTQPLRSALVLLTRRRRGT